jgi:hypothetical protein
MMGYLMEKIQIEVSIDLWQRLQPYQNDLAHILEWGLQYVEQRAGVEPESPPREVLSVLRQAGAIGPDYETMVSYVTAPATQNRSPLQAGGKPASEIIIEQRRGFLDD